MVRARGSESFRDKRTLAPFDKGAGGGGSSTAPSASETNATPTATTTAIGQNHALRPEYGSADLNQDSSVNRPGPDTGR